jgi:hypothetical protein
MGLARMGRVDLWGAVRPWVLLSDAPRRRKVQRPCSLLLLPYPVSVHSYCKTERLNSRPDLCVHVSAAAAAAVPGDDAASPGGQRPHLNYDCRR